MAGGQRHHRRLQARAKPGRGDQLRQPGAGPRAAVPAAQLVRAMLGQDHADRWQLGDRVATDPPLGLQLPGRELTATPAARLRVVIDDLIDLILRAQLATGTAMPRLPTRLAPPALPAHQLLAFRPPLRPPLRPRLRRIHRRRRRTGPRVPPRLLLKPLQPILVLLKPRREIENELHTRLTPRVIDRLRLGAVHARKIRCTNKESLPQAPTTERLQKPTHLQGILTVTPDGTALTAA